jgi:hypothetical protein
MRRRPRKFDTIIFHKTLFCGKIANMLSSEIVLSGGN